MTTIVGIDPGTRISGFCAIRMEHGDPVLVEMQTVKLRSRVSLPDRLLDLFEWMERELAKLQPDQVVVESVYVGPKIRAAVPLAEARGVIILAARRSGAEIVEMRASEARKAVLAKGNASKDQVRFAVRRILGMEDIPEENAADAAALAIACGWGQPIKV